VMGNISVEQATENTLAVLEVAGRPDVEVATGGGPPPAPPPPPPRRCSLAACQRRADSVAFVAILTVACQLSRVAFWVRLTISEN
jgi:hypothetical protein